MKKCKSCQSLIDNKAKKCPKCQTDQRNWFAKHPVITVILALILIGMMSGGSKNNQAQKVGSTQNGQPTVKTDTSKTEQKFKLGEQIKLGNVLLTVNKAESSQGGQYIKPSEGNKYFNINLTIENQGSTQQAITTLGQMFIIDGDGNQYQVAVTNKVMENPNNSLDGSIIAKAKKTGWVGFEVPKTSKNLTFRYNASMWSDKAVVVDLE